MSLLIASTEQSKLVEEQARIERNAKGESGVGIVSARISSDDLKELEENVTTYDEKAQTEPIRYMPLAIYAQAMARDAHYALQGRKFMRAMSLNTRTCIAYNRAYMIEETKPKE